MNIQHSSRTDEWFTPLDILVRVKKVLGPIDLDPASCAAANLRVGAKYYLTKEMNALKEEWPPAKTIFCNPPGGKTKNKSNTALFWHKFRQASETTDFAGIFLAFSLEALQTTQSDSGGILQCATSLCVPRRRIAFDRPDGTPGPAPSHSNVIALVTKDRTVVAKFHEAFLDVGEIVR